MPAVSIRPQMTGVHGLVKFLILITVGCALLLPVLARQGDTSIDVEQAREPAALWVDAQGEARLSWLAPADGAWVLKGVRLTPGAAFGSPELGLPIPDDAVPHDMAIAALDAERTLVGWREGGRFWSCLIEREVAGSPVLISESATAGGFAILATEGGHAQLLWTEGDRTLWTTLTAFGPKVQIRAHRQILGSELRAAAPTDGGTLAFGSDQAVFIDGAVEPITPAPGVIATMEKASSSFAVAGWRDRLALAWTEGDGSVKTRWIGGSSRIHELRPADGASIADVRMVIGEGGAWVSWLETRGGERARVVKGVPEIFADDFETGDTSSWSETEPPVYVRIVSPTDGEAVADTMPQLAVIYGTPTGLGVDAASLAWSRAGSPLDMTCNALPTEATCSPVSPFIDGNVTLEATVSDLMGNPSHPQFVTFEIDSAAPLFESLTPADGLVTSASEVTFAGTVSEPALVQLDAEPSRWTRSC